MQPREDVVDPKESEENPAKTYDGEYSGLVSPPPSGQPGMQEGGINQPGDKGPGLLRIPAPVTSPRVVCPHSSRDNTYAQEQKTYRIGLVNNFIQNLHGGECG